MPIANTGRVLNYLPYAMGSYGTGPGTAGTSVGTATSVEVPRFQATPDSGFQGSLYKDATTGKYVVAFANSLSLFSTLGCIGRWGAVAAVVITVLSSLFGDDDLPTFGGLAQASLDDCSQFVTVVDRNDDFARALAA